MRHRRRCKGPAKKGDRRKACDVCVRNKVKCCLTQPTCSRCAKRGMKCVYGAPSAAVQGWNGNYPEHMAEVLSARKERLQSCQDPSIGQSSVPELPNWDFPISRFPPATFDFNIADMANVSPVPHLESLLEKSYISPMTHGHSSSTSLTQTSNNSTGSPSNDSTWSAPLILTSILGDYCSSLTKDSCFSPFLHLPKVKNVEPDLTSFPFTSMAICSSTGLNLSTDKQFFRRAIDAARHRLIGQFVRPTYAQLRSDQMLRDLLAIVRVYGAVGCDTCYNNLRELGD